MRRTLAATFIVLVSLLGIAALAQQGPSPIGPVSGGGTVTGTSPIVVTGSVISCPTCGTGTGNAQTANPLSQFAATTSAQLAGVLTNETGTGLAVFNASPALTTPDLGTPSAINLTNATGAPTWNQNTTGSAASLSVSGQSGLFTIAGLTGTNRIKTVRDAADTLLELGGSYTPTGTWTSMSLVTPSIGAATGTSLSLTGQFTSTQATGTAPFVVASTTNVANLNASSLSGATFAAPGAIGSGTASTGAFTTLTASSTTTLSGAGAASTSPFLLNGTPFVGGTGTTNFPYAYLNFGNAPTSFSTSGVLFGINTASGFAGNTFELHNNGGSTVMSIGSTGNISTNGNSSAAKFTTASNCSASGTAANPSVVTCTSASSGAFACATNASGGTCQVNTSAASTNSDIQITPTASAGTRLSVTCNTTADTPTAPRIASISNGASFTINLGTVTTNPTCYFYTITN